MTVEQDNKVRRIHWKLYWRIYGKKVKTVIGSRPQNIHLPNDTFT